MSEQGIEEIDLGAAERCGASSLLTVGVKRFGVHASVHAQAVADRLSDGLRALQVGSSPIHSVTQPASIRARRTQQTSVHPKPTWSYQARHTSRGFGLGSAAL